MGSKMIKWKKWKKPVENKVLELTSFHLFGSLMKKTILLGSQKKKKKGEHL